MRLKFTKMHGLGNDFVVLDGFSELPTDSIDFSQTARVLCDRRFSIGADGLIAILPEKGCDARMRIFNADGSEAQMCGNGIRCVARYLYTHGIRIAERLDIATMSGPRDIRIKHDYEGNFLTATVDMGLPDFTAANIPVISPNSTFIDQTVWADNKPVRLSAVSIGNPHGVVFVSDIMSAPVNSLGPLLEQHEIWPEKANIEFAEIRPDRIRVRAWERGVGETMACGTGACAVAAVLNATGRARPPFIIELPGGMLHIDLAETGHILMTGPATETFTGEVELRRA